MANGEPVKSLFVVYVFKTYEGTTPPKEPHHFPNEYTGPTGGAATSKDDVETAPFQCEYRWYLSN